VIKENVLLVVVDFMERDTWPAEDIAAELKELVISCGATPIETMICHCQKPTANFLIGKGKVEEIASACLKKSINLVIFSHDLKGSQQRNLEEAINVRTIDRTQLILDIFARHAKSLEGKMQVELAQLEYLLPRLVGHGVEMSRLGGGIGTVGPGETKLEVDRRRISTRIGKLKNDLKEIAASRKVNRNKRKDSLTPSVALVGYTNAGKSTLLNALTDAHQRTHDGLFTTLDSLSRQYTLPNHQKIVVSDTVGFMYDLPHHLIEAFKTTLDEVVEADLLLHVLDVSNPRFRQLNEAVLSILAELGTNGAPMIMVLNKIDRVDDQILLRDFESRFKNCVAVSALTGENLDQLIKMVTAHLAQSVTDIDVSVPIHRMDLVNLVHSQGKVHSINYLADSVHIQATVPLALARKFQ